MPAGEHHPPPPETVPGSLAAMRRFARAAAEVTHGSGIRGITVAAVAETAGAAPRAFDETFDDLDACLRFGVLDTFERITAPLQCLPGGDWRERLEAAIGAYYAAIAAEPLLAELYLLHSYEVTPGPGDPGLHDSVLAFAPFLAAAAAESGQESLPPGIEDFLGWAIVAAATRAVRLARTEELTARSAEVAAFVAIFFTPDDQRRRQAREAGRATVGVPQPPDAVPSPK
jgi:AcrR family transcriptional regulator